MNLIHCVEYLHMIRKTFAVLGLAIVALGAVLFWSYSATVAVIPVQEKVVALTYDDGPNPPHTEALLDMLAQHNVKATFFLKGRNIEAFPETVKDVVEAGHEIGNHSYFHKPMIAFSESGMLEELVRTNNLIEQYIGDTPTLFRPPFGVQGPGLKMALDTLGMTSVLMSTHGEDWEVSAPQLIADAVLENIEPGSVILLHDGHGDVDDPNAQQSRAPSVEATGIIIETLQAQGYRFKTVGEMLAMSRL
jgi:peptidoglycan/xylan/chitin deacetylase (PgdA/CDA1 family)